MNETYKKQVANFIRKNNLQTLSRVDDFKSKYFNGWEWSAPFIQQPSVLKEFVEIIGLIGARIKEVNVVDDSIYDLGRIRTSSLYPDMCVIGVDPSGGFKYEEWDYEEIMAWLNELKETDLYFRDVLKPVIVMTDRGVFEIDFHESSSVRISKDCIPERYYNNSGNRFNRSFDLRKILALLNGDIINNISVEEQNFSDADFQFTGICNIVLDSKFSSYIKTFTLHLESGRKIVFFSDFDNGGFYVLDKDDSLIKISTKDLNKYLKVPIGTKIKE